LSSEHNKDVVRRLFQAFDEVDTAAMDELLAPDFVAHGLGPLFSEDVAGWKELAAHWAAGFSDEELTFNDFVAEDSKVAVRWTSRATHSAEVFGVPATNRRVTIKGIEIYHLSDGRCREYWGELNLSDLSGTAEHELERGR
jgi:predicted ester cyclase